MPADFAAAKVRDHMIASPPIVTPRTSVAEALRLLRQYHLPALPLCEGGRVRGLIDEASLLRLTPSEATTLSVYELRDVLDRLTLTLVNVTQVPAVTPDASLSEAASVLLRAGRTVLPVVDGAKLMGLVTGTALLAAAVGQRVLA